MVDDDVVEAISATSLDAQSDDGSLSIDEI